MAVVIFFTVIALILSHVLADNYTTSFVIPDGLFWPSPAPQTFVGSSTITGSDTWYYINCGESSFWPGQFGCDGNNTYFFFANSFTTRFPVQTENLDKNPLPNAAPIANWLQNFNQTVTIDCGPTDTNNQATCVYTSLYNKENPVDKSIISSTLVTRSYTEIDSSIYPIIFTTPTAAAATAAATPAKPTASATSNPQNLTTSSTTLSPIPSPNSSSTTPSPSPAPSTALPPASKAGLGIGLSLGLLLLSALAFLLYRFHRKRHPRARPGAHNDFVPPGSFAGEFEAKEHANVVADTSGVHEMEGRKTPEGGVVFEMPTN